MPHIVNGKKIADILSQGEPKALASEFDMEDVLSFIKSLRDKIDFYNELKKERVKAIQEEIDKVQEKVDFFEKVVVLTMKNSKKKSLDFPGIGKATIVSRKGKWVVNDTEEVVDYLRSQDLAAYHKVVSQKDIISKKELDAVLEMWDKTDQVPDCVEKSDPTESLKLRFKDFSVEEEDDDEPQSANSKPKHNGLNL